MKTYRRTIKFSQHFNEVSPLYTLECLIEEELGVNEGDMKFFKT